MGSMEHPPCWLASAPSTAPCSRHSTGHQYIFISPGSSRVSILECVWHIYVASLSAQHFFRSEQSSQAAMNLYKSAGPTHWAKQLCFMLTSGPVFLAMSSEPKRYPSIPANNYIHHGSRIGPISISWCDSCHGCAKKGCLMMCWMRQSTWSANWCWAALVRFHQGCRSLMLFIAVSCILCVRLKGIWAKSYRVHHGCRRWYEVGVPQTMHGFTTSINHHKSYKHENVWSSFTCMHNICTGMRQTGHVFVDLAHQNCYRQLRNIKSQVTWPNLT